MTIDFTPSPDLYPFESKWFESSVGRVHYIDEGEGRPIVFCHGQPMWSFLYRHIVIGLRDRFRCVVIDYPGYGLSVRPDGYGYTPREHAGVVGELVDHLALDDMIVMGQDWGGPISLPRCSTHSGDACGFAHRPPGDPGVRRLARKPRNSGESEARVETSVTGLGDEGRGLPPQIPGSNERGLPRPSSGGATRCKALHPRRRPGRDHYSHHRPIRLILIRP